MEFNEFADSIKALSVQVQQRKSECGTEEATKMSLICPLFQRLGYDTSDPTEFCPEYVADVGIKKGEKVDYAIKINGEPHILIECKHWKESLDNHGSQLFRYFGTTKAKYGILTNGIIYRFYTDIDEDNKMDLEPFLELDMSNLKDNAIASLKRFSKENYDRDLIYSAAEELKASKLIKEKLQMLMENPDDDFTRLIVGYFYDGVKNQKVIDKYKPIIKKSFNSYISEAVNARLSSALNEVKGSEEESKPEGDNGAIEESKIKTTEEELQAFLIIKALLAERVPVSDIDYRDTETYFLIAYKGKPHKPICRLMVEKKNKYILIPNEKKEFIKTPIESIYDLHKFKDALISVVNRYIDD